MQPVGATIWKLTGPLYSQEDVGFALDKAGLVLGADIAYGKQKLIYLRFIYYIWK